MFSLRAAPRPLALCVLVASIPFAGSPALSATDMRFCDPFMLQGPVAQVRAPQNDSAGLAARAWARPEPWPAMTSTIRRASEPAAPSAVWAQLEPLELGSVLSNLIVDKARDRLVLFGGYSFTRFTNHVWTRPLGDDHAEWARIEVAGPAPGRYTASTSIYDPVRERLIALGGEPGDGVWALSLSGTPRWQRLAFASEGPAGKTNGTTAIYDPVGDRIILVAGGSALGADVWAFSLGDSSGWTQLHPSGPAPLTRDNYHAVYDSNRHRMVMFSGYAPNNGIPADLWALNLGDVPAWEQLPMTGDLPPGLYQGAAAFDAVHDRMVVADGIAANDLGEGTDAGWVIQFGGVPYFRRILPAVRPVGRNGPCMAYDETRDRFVMFGGGISDTWSLAIGADTVWTLMQRDVVPPFPCYKHALVEDPRRHRLLRLGGHVHYFIHGTPQPGEFATLWTLQTDSLERYTPDDRALPTPMAGMSLVLDAAGDRLLTFGGHSMASGTYGVPLQLALGDDSGWQPIVASGPAPPARTMQSAVMDPTRRRVVLFGGQSSSGALGDGWVLDLNGPPAWTQLDSLALAPAPRFGHGAVLDPIGDRMILFGGCDGSEHAFNDTWQLSLAGTPVWSRLALSTAPSPRSHAAVTYDPIRQRVVLFGGRDGNGQPLHDTWYLPLATGASWIQADSSGPLPRERWAAAATYDVEHDRLVVLNGTFNPCSDPEDAMVSDEWEMHSLDAPPEPLVLQTAEQHPQQVDLEWRASFSGRFMGTVSRRVGDAAWEELGAVRQDGDGAIRFEDLAPVRGVPSLYRVTWSVGAVAGTTSPVKIDAPQFHLGLSPGPLPATDGLRVSISLPDGAPAKLELIDVAGRRLLTRDVAQLGPGDHNVQLATRGGLIPGHYWVRLVHPSGSLSRMVTLLR